MRRLFGFIASISIVAGSGLAGEPRMDVDNVLFVGNSLTYVGNLPAVFDAVAKENRRATASDMIVAGGATLTDRVNDGSVARALLAKKYSYVVLQERGGDFSCGFGPEICARARTSLNALVDLVRKHGAIPILLGTYQGNARASQELVQAESTAAQTAGIQYISVSDRFQVLQTAHPGMSWLASDGMHPGSSLTLLDATLLFEGLYKEKPRIADVSVHAPIYGIRSGLAPEVRSAGAPSGEPTLETGITYRASDVAQITDSRR